MANIIAAFCFGILFTMVILVMTAGLCWAASRGDDAWDATSAATAPRVEGHDD